MSELSGVLPVCQTPYHVNEQIDIDTLRREIDWLIECGADGIVIAMVSEVLRLSNDERREPARFACDAIKGRGSCVISVGAESSILAESFAKHAQECGATAVMAIGPVSIAVTESELLGYYRRIIQSISIP